METARRSRRLTVRAVGCLNGTRTQGLGHTHPSSVRFIEVYVQINEHLLTSLQIRCIALYPLTRSSGIFS